jgi:hypothetical protein
MFITRALGDKRAIAFLLENFARAAMLQNDAPRALQLIGAASTLRSSAGAMLPETEQKNLNEWFERARAQLHADDAETFLARGNAMSMADAIEYAIQA